MKSSTNTFSAGISSAGISSAGISCLNCSSASPINPSTSSLITNSPSIIEAKNIAKSFGTEQVLGGISFCLKPGKSLAVVSPSGTGKSTLLSILGLVQSKTSGQLFISGRDTDNMSAAEKDTARRLEIGFIFQHTQLLGSQRAIENVLMPARLLHRHDRNLLESRISGGISALEKRAASLLRDFAMQDRAYHFPHQLSVGQKRRVAVARALLLNPSLLIADEPTNDLDSDSAALVTKKLFEHVNSGHALVFATHDVALASCANEILELGTVGVPS